MRAPSIRLFLSVLAGISVALLLAACSSKASPSDGNGEVTTYVGDFGWVCADSVSCQDVFDLDLTVGTTLSLRVNAVSQGSVAQIALYGPGVQLGGINLLTGDASELRCISASNCSLYTAGEHVDGFPIAQTGTYRLAITRDWGASCGGSGTYQLNISRFAGLPRARPDH